MNMKKASKTNTNTSNDNVYIVSAILFYIYFGVLRATRYD